VAAALARALARERLVRRVRPGGGPAQGAWVVTGLAVLAAGEAGDGRGAEEAEATPLARLVGERQVVVVPRGSRLRDFGALADALRRDPGCLTVAGGPVGGPEHLLYGLIAQGLGVDARRVQYRAYASGDQVASAMLGGRVPVAIGPVRGWRDRVAARQARALAVSSAERLPDVEAPSLLECGVGVDYADWCGLVGPRGMREGERDLAIEVCDRLGDSPVWREECRAHGWTMIHLTGDGFGEWLGTELVRIRTVLRDLGLRTRPGTTCRGTCVDRH
ncbi:Bug family tripartite tricarboxylate transporter substrate binding protein, partial [Thermocatellispora tengchongensis]|uniref:Bug family tripartite tricarboxylate transporter substrate binding protein n=1 Tax=Thermocatellispora tengchongensis TaxID=1073253 RepID=UPI0031EC01DD